jgi:splicing factor U2AF subunit
MGSTHVFVSDGVLRLRFCLQEELSKFLGDAIINVGAAVSSQGRPVTFCRVQRDKNFAFVEVRSAEEASNVMALDGLVFKDVPLKVRRIE